MSELVAIRRTYLPDAQVAMRIVDVPLAVHTNEPRLLTSLRDYFAPYLTDRLAAEARHVFVIQGEPAYDAARLRDVPRSPGKSIKEAFYDAADARIVMKRKTGVVIYVAEPDHYVVGDLVANFNQAVNAVMMVFAKAMLQRSYVMLHASAVLGDAGGIAFASPSGSGKSTMALALVEHHYQFVTNDRLFVRSVDGFSAEMCGVPKRPRVNPGTLFRIPRLASLATSEERSHYASLRAEELWTVEQKHDVDVDAIYGPGTVHLQGRLKAIFLLRWGPVAQGWNVRPLGAADRRAALGQLVKRVGVYHVVPPQDGETRAVNAVADTVTMYEVTGRADVGRLADVIVANAQ